MMGTADPQPSMFYQITLEQFVTTDHPLRKIRPLIDTVRLRQLCEPLYAEGVVPRFHRNSCFWRFWAAIWWASHRNAP